MASSLIADWQLFQPLLAQKLATLIDQKIAAQTINPDLNLGQRLKKFVTGGKLIRGCLVLTGYQLVGQPWASLSPNRQLQILDLAMSVELCQSGFLIDDDIIDQDELRRHQPTIHCQYQRDFSSLISNDPAHFGRSMAICVADLLFFWAGELVAKVAADQQQIALEAKILPATEISPAIELSQFYQQEMARTAVGELADVFYDLTTNEPTVEQVLDIYVAKTAHYTVSTPLALGAMLAGADEKLVAQLVTIGVKIGLAFQLQDDYLGIFGEPAKTGKPVGSDIRQNVKTVYRQLLMAEASPTQKSALKNIFGRREIVEADLQLIQKMIKDLEIDQQVTALKDQQLVASQQLIAELPVSSQAQQWLTELGQLLSQRDH